MNFGKLKGQGTIGNIADDQALVGSAQRVETSTDDKDETRTGFN